MSIAPKLGFLLLALSALSLAPACNGEVSLEDRPCPCTSGWTCCASQNVCVAPGTQCPTGLPGIGGFGDAGEAGLGPLLGDAALANPLELANAQSARCFATDRDYVYWQNTNGLVVGSPKKSARIEVSSVQTPFTNNPHCGIAIDGNQLITTAYGLGKLVSLSLESNGEWHIGAESTLFGQLTTPSSLSLGAEEVYVTEFEAGRVSRVPRGRAQTIVLAEGLARPHGVLHDAAFVYFVELGDAATGVGAIKKVPTEGGTVSVVAANQKSPNGLVMWDGRLYWTTSDGVWSADGNGGAIKKLTALSFNLGGIAVDGKSVFFGSATSLLKVDIDGGASVEVYRGTPAAFTADEARLYWADGSSVFSATK